MKKFLFVAVIASLVLAITPAVFAGTGNGAPSGAHYNLNIIGVKNPKTTDMTDSSGHVIFVALEGKSQIKLQEAPEGESFAVLDANGTDGNGALFQLPDPGLDPYIVGEKGSADTVSDYSVFVRPLGKPGGWATITTCADLVDSTFGGLLPGKTIDDILNSDCSFGGFASVEQVGQDITLRPKGKSTFSNVTAELLTIVFKVSYDLDGDGIIEEGEYKYVRVPIFDDSIENEYWEYDNHGLKLLQVRFYPVGTDVSEADLLLP
ncbi:MAG: hypothetical protein A2731_04195 [Candidatus Buchananbacteria bacterium RIFCSPHIGHO2_01_FULL_39_8]|uniref:EF-hand domain-containing protein n=1 Tax=Candidatus Buchananbacteria bacterium RIFCSPHIGHO2_01_FULL_39_8 TaxID=1797533 RepID=A0A1G1XUH8_9BACT|nr:MAG: hypothetical protein A2731_04195 [Candidatus Buchananbacteria bacterium RIFCSPHIGHO2_01_FULL_39_8]